MEWITRLNETINYIEKHLAGKIDYDRLGKIASCSSYHYQRMFSYMAGVPLSIYIRRRRMTLAAIDLQKGEKIIDVALKYGYSSPTAFNRAFRGIHGIAPSLARNSGAFLKSFPPISFVISIKGAEAMDYRIENKEEFRIVGISMPMDTEIEKNFEIVPPMWAAAAADGTLEKLAGLMDAQPMGLIGACVCYGDDNWRYFIAAATTLPAETPFEEFQVPAATWAVFPGEGTSQSIQDLEKRIVTEWLPTSGYEYGNAPDIELYFDSSQENMKYEVWIPIIKK
ncbi:MAG: AraC family transcriptional regulator [Eubacteriaceae bacterium]|nr:AraC family transcriptional regulator [Eubacteriaceae bacterium]